MGKITDRFLQAVGILPYTNRDAIMQEIDELTDEDFLLLMDTSTVLGTAIMRTLCDKCKATHQGSCPAIGAADHKGCNHYGYQPAKWLNAENTRDLHIKDYLKGAR